MKCFYENSWFICGTDEFPGTLADTLPRAKEEGFLSFVRLVGSMYFKKHLSVFLATTPRFTSLEESGLSASEHHKKFIQTIRDSME